MLEEQKLRNALAHMAIPIDIDPESAIVNLIRQTAGNVGFLQARIEELSADPALPDNVVRLPATDGSTWRRAPTERGARLYGPVIGLDKEGDEHVIGEEYRAVVKLYGEERDRLAKYSKLAIDANISRRTIEMAEDQGQMFVTVVLNVFRRMGLTAEQQEMARAALAEEFRDVARRQQVKLVGGN